MLSSGDATLTCRAGLVVGQGSHVEDRVVAAERELEAILSLGRAVASPLRCSPSRDKTGATSCVKSTCTGVFRPSTVTGTVAVLPASRKVRSPLPSALGRISPDRDTSTIPADSELSTIRVTSSVSPVASLPVTRS